MGRVYERGVPPAGRLLPVRGPPTGRALPVRGPAGRVGVDGTSVPRRPGAGPHGAPRAAPRVPGAPSRRAAHATRSYGEAMTRAATVVDRLIGTYQRRISPRKGWSCAHRVAHGGASCSAAVREIVARRGVVRGVVPTAARFVACYQAAALLAQSDVSGVCCCGGIPIPFRFGSRR